MSVIASEIVGSNQPAADVQPDSSNSISFDTSKALEMFEGKNTPQEATPVEQVTPPAQPVAEEVKPDVTNVENASAKQLAQLKDDDIVEVTVGGQNVQVPWKEAKGGIMRQQDYTRSKQQLAREREELSKHANAIQERDALVQLFSNKELLSAVIAEKFPDLIQQMAQSATPNGQPKTEISADDIVTAGDMNAQLTNFAQRINDAIEARIAHATTTIEDRQAAAKLGSQIRSTIDGLFQEHPYIKEIVPDAEDVLRWNVAKMSPQTHEEAIEAFKNVFGGWVENYKAAVENTTKQAVLNKQKLEQNNIQPSGGTQIQPVPAKPGFDSKTGKIDWNALNATAKAMLSSK